MRYGTLVGDFGDALPGRLIRHGAFFDFMMVWAADEPSAEEWSELAELLAQEVTASRALQELLTGSRLRSRKRFRLLHRPQKPHNNAGPAALPHFHQKTRPALGHCFYETASPPKKARKGP